jgi:hypothetical protein
MFSELACEFTGVPGAQGPQHFPRVPNFRNQGLVP